MMNQANIPEMSSQPSTPPDYYRDPGTPSIKDDREFMKKSYSGSIKTRDVSDVARDVKSIVREFEGRVDNESVSEKYAYISFVVPKSEFDSFRDEVEDLTHQKLYTENISSQNQLSTKQQIEQQDEMAQKSLAQLEQEQKALSASHTKTVLALQKQLADIRTQLMYTKTSKASATEGTSEYNRFVLDEQIISQQEQALLDSINNTNSTYNSKNNVLKSRISGANGNIDNIKKTDEQFTDNIETVNGTIDIRWVSHWDLAKMFLPIHPTLAIIILAVIAWLLLRHKKYVPKVEFV
jgi:chromosome segregation ATPase